MDSDSSSEVPSTDNPPDATLEASPHASSLAEDDDLTLPDVEATMVFGGSQDDDDEPFLLGEDEQADEGDSADYGSLDRIGGESLDATIDFGRLAEAGQHADPDYDDPGNDATLDQAGLPNPARPRLDVDGSDSRDNADDMTVMFGMEGPAGKPPSQSDQLPRAGDDATLAADSNAADSGDLDSSLPESGIAGNDSAGDVTESPSTHPGDGSSDRDSATLAFDSERRSDRIGTPNPRELTGLESGGTIPRGPLEQGRGSRSLKPGESQLVGAESVRLRAFLLAEPSGDDTIGIDYAIEDEAGAGGMGVVYKARQQSLDRLVAIKQIKSEAGASESDCNKFVSEAVITGQLEHPNVIPVHDLGLAADGMPFYAMKFVEGDEWEDRIKDLSEAENLSILIQVAQAIAFAHSKEVLHRDLKPGNIMLGKFGEVLVMDWGLAARLDDNSDIQPAGTPIYMPPETALEYLDYAKGRVGGKRSGRSRKRIPAGKYSDVYLLGALLFKIVARRAPHRGKSTFECLRNAAKNEIVKVRRSSELLDIAYRAMATDPEDRYPTAIDFIEALKAYQSHAQSIQIAKTASRELRAAEKLRQEDNADTTEIYASFSRAQHGYQNALDLWSENRKARRRRKKALRLFAEAAYENGDYDLALSMLDTDSEEDADLRAAVQKDQESRQTRLAWFKTLQYATAASLMLALAFIGYSFVLQQDAYNLGQELTRKEKAIADKEMLAQKLTRDATLAEQKALTAQTAANDAAREAQVATTEAAAATERARVAKELAQVASAAKADAEAKAAEADRAGREARRLAKVFEDRANDQAFYAKLGNVRSILVEEGAYAASKVMDGVSPEVRARAEGKPEWRLLKAAVDWRSEATEIVDEATAAGPTYFAVARDSGKAVAAITVAGGSTELSVYSFDRKRLETVTTVDGSTNSVSISAGGRYVALTGSVLRIFDTEVGKELLAADPVGLAKSSSKATCFAFHPRLPELLVGRADTSVELWRIEHGEAKRIDRETKWHQTALTAVGYSPDGLQRFSADASGRLVLWREMGTDSLDAREVYSHSAVASGSPVITAAVMTGETAGRLAYGCDDGSVYEIAGWWPTEGFAGKVISKTDARLRPRVAKRLADGYLDVRPNRLDSVHPRSVTSIDYASEGNVILSAGGSTLLVQTSKYADKSALRFKAERRYHDATVLSVAAGPNNTAYSSDEKGRVLRWQIDVTATEVTLDPGAERRSNVVAVNFVSGDGKPERLSIAGENGFVHRWDDIHRTGDFDSLYAGHADNRDMRAWRLPGGTPRIVTVAADNRACIWREADGLLERVIDLEGRSVVAVDPEIGLLYAASDGRSLGDLPAAVAIPIDGGPSTELWKDAARVSFLLPLAPRSDRDPTLAVGQRDGQIYLWGPTTGRVDLVSSAERPHWRPIQALAVDPSTNRLYSGDSDGRLVEWDLGGKKNPQERAFDRPVRGSASITRLEVVPGKALLAIQRTPRGSIFATYFASSGEDETGITVKRRGLRDVSIDPATGSLVAVCRSAGRSEFVMWSKLQGWHASEIEPTADHVTRIDATDDGWLCWGTGNAHWRLSNDLRRVATCIRSRPRLEALLSVPGDSAVRAVTEIGSLDQWDPTAGTARQEPLGGGSPVPASCVTSDGDELLVAVVDGAGNTKIERWDTSSNQRVGTVASGLPGQCRAMATTPAAIVAIFGDRLVTMDRDGGSQRTTPMELLESRPNAVSTSLDGLQVAVTTTDGNVVLGQRDAPDSWRFSKLDRSGVASAAFTPDGKRLIIGVESGRVILLELEDPDGRTRGSRSLLTFSGHSDRVTLLQVASSGDSTKIVSGDASGRVVVRSL